MRKEASAPIAAFLLTLSLSPFVRSAECDMKIYSSENFIICSTDGHSIVYFRDGQTVDIPNIELDTEEFAHSLMEFPQELAEFTQNAVGQVFSEIPAISKNF